MIPYFRRWMERFPDVHCLAKASSDEVHKAWEGLGYYRRARYLQAAAASIAEHGWPEDFDSLLELPGLGPYTAAALASIAFQWPEPALDGNAFRVLARLLGIEGEPRAFAAPLRAWLRMALIDLGPSRTTQGLMELGAMVCTPLPRCTDCPLKNQCEALRMKATDRIPPARQRAKPKESELWLVALEAQGHWLLRNPAKKGLLAGLWTWPTVEVAAASQLSIAAESVLGYTAAAVRTWPDWTQVYSHRRELIHPLHFYLKERFEPLEGHSWIPSRELEKLAFGKRDSTFRELLKGEGTLTMGALGTRQILGSLRPGASPGL